jgi:hypothetical protein
MHWVGVTVVVFAIGVAGTRLAKADEGRADARGGRTSVDRASPRLTMPLPSRLTTPPSAGVPSDAPSASGERGRNAVDAEHLANFTIGAEVDVASRFIWRGLALSNGPIVEPAAWVSAYGFSAIVWTTLLLTDEPPHRRVRSVLPSLSYTYSWDRFRLEPGVMVYWMGDDIAPRVTAELYAIAEVTFGDFRLANENYVDVKEYSGGYFGSIGPKYEKSIDRWAFKAGVDVALATNNFNEGYFGVDSTELNLAEAQGEVRWDFTDNLYVTVHGEGSVLLASNLWRSVRDPALVSVGTAFGAEL